MDLIARKSVQSGTFSCAQSPRFGLWPHVRSPGGSPSTPKQPATNAPSKMIVEFKTRAGDKWTSLRHYDSGPWSGGGNPHWAAINVTLRAVKSNAGIGERKKDVQDWPHYPAQWSNARGLWDFYSPAHTFAQGMHERLTADNAQDIAGFKFFINSDALRPAVEFSNIDEYVAAIKELPDPDPPARRRKRDRRRRAGARDGFGGSGCRAHEEGAEARGVMKRKLTAVHA